MFAQSLLVVFQLALFRGSPADMPHSPNLLRLAIAAAVLSTLLLMSPLAPLPLALATGIGGAAGVAFFTRQLLKGRKMEGRWQQTVCAQLLLGSVFALALWPAVLALVPTMEEMMAAMRALATATPEQQAGDIEALRGLSEGLKNQPPLWASLWSDVVFVWSLVAATRVYRLAAELNRPASWLLTLVSLFVITGFVMLAQILVAIFF